MIKHILIIILLFISAYANAKLTVNEIRPANWWTNLHYNNLVIIAKGSELAKATIEINSKNIRLIKTEPSQNPNYLLFEIEINKNAQPENIPINFLQDGKVKSSIIFQLLKESKSNRIPINTSDVLYQIVPDRFKDHNQENNNPKEYIEKYDNKNPAGIHGGDFEGIINSIDYLTNLGISVIDLTPVYESNQFFNSYDHCGVTNFYKPDIRLGTINNLKELSTKAKIKNMKLCLTLVLNQMGKQHDLIKNNPFPNWTVPDFKLYSEPRFQHIFSDPYASNSDITNKLQTWPDMDISALNQFDNHLEKFLIQHTIWWINTINADAIRIEKTYMNTPALLNNLSSTLNIDFPGLTIITDYEQAPPPAAEFFCKKLRKENINIKISDYHLANSISNSFSSFIDYNEGIEKLYQSLSDDYIYNNALNNITFIDNNKSSRAFSLADKDPNQLKMMLSVLFTLRGTPQILYGTEALLDGIITGGVGFVRKNMPGINYSNKTNIFTNNGLSNQQIEIIKLIKQLIAVRKNSKALSIGNTTHFIPEDGLYLIFRKYKDETVMTVINNNPNIEKKLESEKYSEQCENFLSAIDLITNQEYSDINNIIIAPKKVMILQLKP
ncbi:MAG: cyclomaltodextrinase N-terminal domain-containing protein [Marinilabiliaceae bacterium]|nr:cyclomaltodextrinase N-terminal domain-containing protein [Marinilabiliaceae bacterium]